MRMSAHRVKLEELLSFLPRCRPSILLAVRWFTPLARNRGIYAVSFGIRTSIARTARMQTKTNHHRCPRCGQRLTIENVSGFRRWICGVFMLRVWYYTPECGWRRLQFSRSLYPQGRRRPRRVVLAVLVAFGATLAIRFALSRVQGRATPTGDEGIQEVAE